MAKVPSNVPQKYLELRVVLKTAPNKQGKIDYVIKNGVPEFSGESPTPQGSVMIDEFTANWNNDHVFSTGLWYRLADKPKENPYIPDTAKDIFKAKTKTR